VRLRRYRRLPGLSPLSRPCRAAHLPAVGAFGAVTLLLILLPQPRPVRLILITETLSIPGRYHQLAIIFELSAATILAPNLLCFGSPMSCQSRTLLYVDASACSRRHRWQSGHRIHFGHSRLRLLAMMLLWLAAGFKPAAV